MTPYFERDGVTLYHSSCLDLMLTMAPRSAGLVLTDPPYTERTHRNMRSNKGRRGSGAIGARNRGGAGAGVDPATGKERPSVNPIDFPPMSDGDAVEVFAAMGRIARRWVVATVAFEHAAKISEAPPAGLRAVRVGAWVKIGPTPQMTGDRPAIGWEAVSILHADGGEEMRWNGGGRAAVWRYQAEMRGEYPTQKPESLISHLLSDFAEPGDLVVDPFSGGGTTLICAWRAGLPSVGCDVREEACEVAARRLEREMAQGRLVAPTLRVAEQPSLL